MSSNTENKMDAMHNAVNHVYSLIDEVKQAMTEHLELCNEVAVALERLDEARLWYSEGLVKHPIKSAEEG